MNELSNYIMTCARQAVKLELLEDALKASQLKVVGQAKMIDELEKEAASVLAARMDLQDQT